MNDHGLKQALRVDQKKKAVGLLFAGSDMVTILNTIGKVFETLGVEVRR